MRIAAGPTGACGISTFTARAAAAAATAAGASAAPAGAFVRAHIRAAVAVFRIAIVAFFFARDDIVTALRLAQAWRPGTHEAVFDGARVGTAIS